MLFFSLDVFFVSASVTNPCDRKKCEWLCLLSPSGPVCTCPNNYVADNGTCVERPSPTESPFCKSARTLMYTCIWQALFHMIRLLGGFHPGCLYNRMRHTRYRFTMQSPLLPPLQLSPQGPAIYSVRTVGAASSTPVRWPSVAASPATPERDVRSTSAGTTARTEAHALLLIQVRARHV